MSGDNPILIVGFVMWMAGYSVAQLMGEMPDPGDPNFPTIMGMVGAFVGSAFHLARKRSIDGIQLTAFMFAFVATGIGYVSFIVAAGY